MHRLLLLLAFLTFGAAHAFAQLTGIHVEKIMDSETFLSSYGPQSDFPYPEGCKTYRIYAELQDPEDVVVSCFAVAEGGSLDISTGSGLWNAPFSGIAGDHSNPMVWSFFPSCEFDSYVTIGRTNNESPGPNINTSSLAPDDNTTWENSWKGFIASSTFGDDFLLQNGFWYIQVNQPELPIPEGPENRMLLAQVTTYGVLSFNLNMVIKDDGVNDIMYIHPFNPVGGGIILINDTPILISNDLSVDTSCGDPAAINYSPLGYSATNCRYGGTCIDEEALNYAPDAPLSGECIYANAPNDCASATELSIGNSAMGNTYGGSITGSSGVCWPNPIEHAVWYKFTATTETHSIISSGITAESDYAVYDACGGTELECGSFTEQTDFIIMDNLIPGNDYYVLLNTAQEESFYLSLYEGSPSCSDPDAINYDVDSEFEVNVNCIYEGCTDPEACNFDPSASVDDGSCDPSLSGCTIPSAENYNEYALCNDGSCIIYDCTNPDACNYNPLATNDDGSCLTVAYCENINAWNYQPGEECYDPEVCIYEGCTDPEACNYYSLATLDDGSCVSSGTMLTLRAYIDENENGQRDSGEPIRYNSPFHIMPNDIIVYSGYTTGGINFLAQSGVDYQITLLDISETVEPHPNSIDINVTGSLDCETLALNLGYVSTAPAYSFDLIPISWASNIHCNDGMAVGLWIRNDGTESFSGSITLELDDIFEIEPLNAGIPPTSINPGIVTWTIEDLPVEQSRTYRALLVGPGANPDLIGESFVLNYQCIATDEQGNIVASDSRHHDRIVECAYDPNDKLAEPVGYAAPHFIRAEDEIEYRIRFQNTGNIPAEDINIIDTLDIEHLDLSTFTPRYGSHNFETCVFQSDGIVDFVFENIMLPDSSSDLEGSQGFVVFTIKPKADISPGTEINNTAYIYFEENPPIVTNTTWHTIYDCNDLNTLLSPDSIAFCAFTEMNVEVEYPYVESYDWFIDDALVEADGENLYDLSSIEEGEYILGLGAENPLCTGFSTASVNVLPVPEAVFSVTQAVLIAISGESYQWYFNGEVIEGATEQNYIALANGNYSVEITNAEGCSDLSSEQTVIVVGIGDEDALQFVVYPNPSSDQVFVQISNTEEVEFVRLIDMGGRKVLEQQVNKAERIQFSIAHLSPGNYFVEIETKNGTLKRASVIVN